MGGRSRDGAVAVEPPPTCELWAHHDDQPLWCPENGCAKPKRGGRPILSRAPQALFGLAKSRSDGRLGDSAPEVSKRMRTLAQRDNGDAKMREGRGDWADWAAVGLLATQVSNFPDLTLWINT